MEKLLKTLFDYEYIENTISFKNISSMEIGIIGSGNIGSALAAYLTALGHQVSIANSRGPETLKLDSTVLMEEGFQNLGDSSRVNLPIARIWIKRH